MTLKADISRIITWLTGSMIGIGAVLLPAGYFALSYQHAVGALEAEVEINARLVSQVVAANPDLWQFEQTRIGEYLARRPRRGQAETRRVFDQRGGLVAESADAMQGPFLARSLSLWDAGVVVGRMEISRSLRPLLTNTALIALLTAPLAFGAFFIVHLIPIRAIRRAEEDLRRERDNAQRYLDVAGVMFVVLDAGRKVALINRKGCELLGHEEHEVLGRDWLDHFVPAEGRREAAEVFARLREGGAGQRGSFEGRLLSRGAGVRHMLWYAIALPGEPGAPGILLSGEDISERVRLEEQLRHSQKLEAIGQLAGGVAHDFNNILAAIMGYASLMHMKMGLTDPHRHNVEQILAASERAAYVTRSLLAFSRKQIMNPRTIDLNEVIRRFEKLLHRVIGADIELRTDLAPEPVTIYADAMQIEQVLMNLATNARDAMPNGGRLVLETRLAVIDSEFIASHQFGQPGTMAVLTVSDTGTGMDTVTQERLFEPFYTTKEVGKGTGLGLAIVYGIVKQHKGIIEVQSEPGKGTVFRLYFVLARDAAEAMSSVERPAPSGGGEVILIGEDDVTVRTMTRSVLQEFGYTVIEAIDGEDAVRKFAEEKDRIALVLLDIIMPRKNGKEAFDEIRRLRPGVKALFLSGYTADIMNQRGLLEEGMELLAKPATPAELLQRVRNILDR